jgi:hypothetical protein
MSEHFPADGLPPVPAGLRAVYALYAARLCAPGVRLLHYGGRWLALRRERALDARVLPVADEEPYGDRLTGFKQFQRDALALVAPGTELVFVALEHGTWRPRGVNAPLLQMLAIRLEVSGCGIGLAGHVDLDEQGRPLRVAPAFALVVDLRLL